MLTRKEISSTLNPSVDLQKEYESSRNKNKERKSNLIKKSTFNNNPIDLYLPIRKNAISIHKPCVTLSNNQLLSKSSSLNTSVTLPMISSKNNDSNVQFNFSTKDQSTKNILATLNKVHDKIKDLDNIELVNQRNMEKLNRFNINHLIKKVKMITNSVDMTHKADKTKKYRKLAIKQKKDSRPIEELYSIEATNERLHLQRMILNVEYDNIVNKNKNNSLERNNSFSRRRSYKRATSVKKTFFYKLAENKAIKYTKNNRINEIMAKYQKEREDIDLKYEHLRTSANNSRRENRKKASYLNVEQNNEDFIYKYKSYLQNVEKEEMQHYSNRIFDKEEIEKIIKSKKDLVMEGLKRDYMKHYRDTKDYSNKKIPKVHLKALREKFHHNMVDAFDENNPKMTDNMLKYKIEDYIN